MTDTQKKLSELINGKFMLCNTTLMIGPLVAFKAGEKYKKQNVFDKSKTVFVSEIAPFHEITKPEWLKCFSDIPHPTLF